MSHFNPTSTFQSATPRKLVQSCISTRRAMTATLGARKVDPVIPPIVIEDLRGYPTYQKIRIIKRDLEAKQEKGVLHANITQFMKELHTYADALIDDCPTNHTSYLVRLHYLFYTLLADISNFIEGFLTSQSVDYFSLLTKTLKIESVVYTLLFLENAINTISVSSHRSKINVSQELPFKENISPLASSTQALGSQAPSMTQSNTLLRERASSKNSDDRNTGIGAFCLCDVVSQFAILSNLMIDMPINWKEKLFTCNALTHPDNFKSFEFSNQRSKQELGEYFDKMSRVPMSYFKGFNGNKENFSRAYSWMPIIFGVSYEEFFASLIHFVKDEEKKAASVAYLLEYWRKVPNVFSETYMMGMYKIFLEIVQAFKTLHDTGSIVQSMRVSFDPNVLIEKVKRFPQQYFYVYFLFETNETSGNGCSRLKKKVDILAYWVSQSLYESINDIILNKEFHEYFIEVIVQLYYLRHNLLATLGLSIGFSSFRLNRFAKPQLRPDLMDTREWVNELTNPKDGSYPNLIQAMKELGNPCIPYFGSFQNIFEKVLSADIQDVGVLYLNIGKATEETRRNRIKWSDLTYEDTQMIDNALGVQLNEFCETPWSDAKLFDSMVKSTKYRVLHIKDNKIMRRKVIPMLKMNGGRLLTNRVSVCRYRRYAPV
ncbi:hypothetical protein EIN_485700 [Entamoeba invadens IP1]|uniref:Ras-GEF domain-containing protein n=1 Tax=Entamoeba invadens IP1 TaxID=370355 RepID=A0A0A1UAG1_ENTIV|nr:hypothetical protein EIN_485700 [Entamoeba invadens IP1]ELP89178.1 hypothetical protein EIN_485700 [Entamoeba invadens IP1]|eukprot:XP_004255949.1 hypothetical protein EIN_485700 [Entamoeba invadens IP1]